MNENDVRTDVSRLESYLSDELDQHVVASNVLQNGINLTIAMSTGRRQNAYVLRQPTPLRRIDYFSDVHQEYDVLQQLEDTSISAPLASLFCGDESIAERPFFLMTYLDGTATPWGSTLPERYRSPQARQGVSDCLIDTLAEIHSTDTEPFESVCEVVTPDERVDQAVDRLERATSVTDRELPRLWDVADWLQANAPSGATTALVHGDYKPDNVLVTGDPPRLAGVIDWEAATLGDALIDLGFLLFFWRERDDPTPSIGELEAMYPNSDTVDQLRRTNEHGFWPFTSRSGSSTRRELVARYEEQTGVSFENERFYRALAPFTIATVWETLHRFRGGADGDSHWRPLVDYMALIADSMIDGAVEL